MGVAFKSGCVCYKRVWFLNMDVAFESGCGLKLFVAVKKRVWL